MSPAPAPRPAAPRIDPLRPLPWQQELWRDCSARAYQQQLGHALLLAGPPGVGKRHFARALIALLLCEADSGGFACGQCRSCEQFKAGSNPNASLLCTDGYLGLAGTADGRHERALQHWEPDKDSKRRDIATDAVRRMIETISLTAHYGRPKVVLIDPAELLNITSVAALLKTIEEPPPATHLLLVTERAQSLIATLRSRCQRLNFAPPPEAIALEWLRGESCADAEAALQAARGAPLQALAFAGSDRLRQQREWQSLWLAVAQRKRDPLAAAADIGTQELPELLNWLMGWLAGQMQEAMSAAGGKAAALPLALGEMLGEATDSQRRLRGNAQPQLLLEALLIRWAQVTRPGA